MKIEYLGHSCFRIISENGVSVLTDPYKKVGYELPLGLQADVVTVSHAHFDHNNVEAISAKNVADKAERYAFSGIELDGIESFHDEKQGSLRGKNVIFKIRMDGAEICHLGDLGEAYSEELAKAIGKPDVLLIPIGGTYTITALEAKQYMERIAPKITIPMHYRPKDGSIDIMGAEEFLKLFPKESIVSVKGEICLKREELLENAQRIIFMERKNS